MWNYIHTDELTHHGILGMKWGVRKDRKITKRAEKDARVGNKWATSISQPSSRKASTLGGLYAATGSRTVGKALEKANDKDEKRFRRAQQFYEKRTGVSVSKVTKDFNRSMAEKYVDDFIKTMG